MDSESGGRPHPAASQPELDRGQSLIRNGYVPRARTLDHHGSSSSCTDRCKLMRTQVPRGGCRNGPKSRTGIQRQHAASSWRRISDWFIDHRRHSPIRDFACRARPTSENQRQLHVWPIVEDIRSPPRPDWLQRGIYKVPRLGDEHLIHQEPTPRWSARKVSGSAPGTRRS